MKEGCFGLGDAVWCDVQRSPVVFGPCVDGHRFEVLRFGFEVRGGLVRGRGSPGLRDDDVCAERLGWDCRGRGIGEADGSVDRGDARLGDHEDGAFVCEVVLRWRWGWEVAFW